MSQFVLYAVSIAAVLALCALGLSIGLLLRGRALQSCGRAQTRTAEGEDIACPACGQGECKRKAESEPARVST
jgi:hypothetical protein